MSFALRGIWQPLVMALRVFHIRDKDPWDDNGAGQLLQV